MSDKEILMLVLEWIRDNVDYKTVTRLFDDIPAAHIILQGDSVALRKLRLLEGTED